MVVAEVVEAVAAAAASIFSIASFPSFSPEDGATAWLNDVTEGDDDDDDDDDDDGDDNEDEMVEVVLAAEVMVGVTAATIFNPPEGVVCMVVGRADWGFGVDDRDGVCDVVDDDGDGCDVDDDNFADATLGDTLAFVLLPGTDAKFGFAGDDDDDDEDEVIGCTLEIGGANDCVCTGGDDDDDVGAIVDDADDLTTTGMFLCLLADCWDGWSFVSATMFWPKLFILIVLPGKTNDPCDGDGKGDDDNDGKDDDDDGDDDVEGEGAVVLGLKMLVVGFGKVTDACCTLGWTTILDVDAFWDADATFLVVDATLCCVDGAGGEARFCCNGEALCGAKATTRDVAETFASTFVFFSRPSKTHTNHP